MQFLEGSERERTSSGAETSTTITKKSSTFLLLQHWFLSITRIYFLPLRQFGGLGRLMFQIKHSTKDLSGQIPQRLQPQKLQRQQYCYLFIHEWAKEPLKLFSVYCATADHSFLLHLLPTREAPLDRQQHGWPAFSTFLGGCKGESRGQFHAPAGSSVSLRRASWRRVTTSARANISTLAVNHKRLPPFRINAKVTQGSLAERMSFSCR